MSRETDALPIACVSFLIASESLPCLRKISPRIAEALLKSACSGRQLLQHLDRFFLEPVRQLDLAGAQLLAGPREQLGLAPGLARVRQTLRRLGEAAAALVVLARARAIAGAPEHLRRLRELAELLVARARLLELLEHAVEVARRQVLARFFEAARGLGVVALVAVVLAEQAQGIDRLAERLQHLGRARDIAALLEQRRRLLLAAVRQRELRRRNPERPALEDGLRLRVEAGSPVEIARHPHELARLGLARGVARRRARRFFDDHLLEALGRLLPLVALDVGLRRMPREIRLRIAVAGAAEVAGLLEHLGGDALVARFEVGLGGALVLSLLAEDAPCGIELAALQIELGALDEAILVVADLGRAHVLLALDEVRRGLFEQAARKAVLGGIQRAAALGQQPSPACAPCAACARRPSDGHRRAASLVFGGLLLAPGQQRRDQQQQARGREPVARDRAVQEGLDGHRKVLVETERLDGAQHAGGLVHELAGDAERRVPGRVDDARARCRPRRAGERPSRSRANGPAVSARPRHTPLSSPAAEPGGPRCVLPVSAGGGKALRAAAPRRPRGARAASAGRPLTAPAGKPKYSRERRVATRPRGVRARKPSWIRNGSTTSSSVPLSSPTAAASVSRPTGPPSNFSSSVRSRIRSSRSKPEASTSRRSSAKWARARSMSVPGPPSTSAKSRTRRSSRLATRGVPREREESSAQASAPSADTEHPRRALQDPLEIRGRVVLEPRDPAEAVAQRRREQPRARRRADQREARQIEAHRARARPLPDQDVELEVLHRRVEDLLDCGGQAVDLVDEQHVAGLEVREQRREIAGPLDRRTARHAQRRPHLVGDDVRERGLAEPRRPMEEHVIERLGPIACRPHEDLQVLAQAILADHLRERARAQALVQPGVLGQRRAGDLRALALHVVHLASLLSDARTRVSSVAVAPASAAASSTTRSACVLG